MKKKEGNKLDPKDVNTTSIVNKCKVFRDVTLNLPKCRAAMISILQATALGVDFTEKEHTELFFSLTQLFHSPDSYIHRLLVLLLKQIPVNSHDAIIITHSLSKDITGSESSLQGHAIRCLCSLLDASNVLALERFLKLAIVSPIPYTSSAAICGALRIIEGGRKEAVLRWMPEIRQASKSPQRSVRFHALLLLHVLKSDDAYASAQLASNLEDAKSQLEQCVSIAIAAQSLKAKHSDSAMGFLKGCLSTGSPIVKLEAIRRCPPELCDQTCDTLSSLLGSSTLKSFAAIRTIAMSNSIQCYKSLLPQILALMKHQNSSLAAMSSVCVLRLGDQSHVETVTKRILKNCKKWASPLLRAVAEESCRFAGKFKSEKLTDVAVFLLRMSTDQQSKFSILRALLCTEGIPRSQLLPRLSEYLEDWDSLAIARTICDFIASQVTLIEDPSSLIPVLYNRVNLDVSSVRMAALNTIGSIAQNCAGMKDKIIPLLELYNEDEDDLVREQVLMILHSLKSGIDISSIFTPFSMQDLDVSKPVLLEKVDQPSKEDIKVSFVPVTMNSAFEKYGKLLWKQDAVNLTERDTEFVVSYFLNVYEEYLILEFICMNTVEDSLYENIHIGIDGLSVIESTTSEKLGYQQTVSTCCVIKRDEKMMMGSYKASLLYTPEDEDIEDEYELGQIKLDCSTWMKSIQLPNFNATWEQTQLIEAVNVFSMQKDKTTSKAAKRIEEEIIRLEKIDEDKDKKKITMKFSAKTIEDSKLILITAELGMSKAKGVICRVSVRSESEELSECVLQSLAF